MCVPPPPRLQITMDLMDLILYIIPQRSTEPLMGHTLHLGLPQMLKQQEPTQAEGASPGGPRGGLHISLSDMH